MSEYRPTEYVVDFGDCRSNRFVGLNMVLIKQNGAKLHERIVRCRDCKWLRVDMSDHEYRSGYWCDMGRFDPKPDGFYAWGERRED
ncbi:MAG: hypothetical protein IJ087_12575 [Eggerthellaceae bacterium]|nr:hypothetical protein [Eggerthellaceae bacterium]